MAREFRQKNLNTIYTSDSSRVDPEKYPHFRRNYFLGISNGVFFNSGMSFFERTTIIPTFLSLLGAPSILISFMSLFETLGWHLPQFLASKLIVHKQRKMPLYVIAGAVRVTGLLLVVLAAWEAGNAGLGTALLLFGIGFGLFAGASGFAGLVFMEVLASTCPKEKRGSYFSWRAILGGLCGLTLGVAVIKPVFIGFAFPTNYLIVFALGTALVIVSIGVFAMQKEPTPETLPPKRSFKTQFTNARRILLTNAHFRTFIMFRGLMMLWLAGMPFYILFARDKLGATEGDIGLFTSWGFAGLMVANVLWGFISNRLGNRVLLVIACSMGVVVSVGTLLFDAGLFPLWSFGIVFFMVAAVDSGAGTGGINYALEIVPEGERPTYVGLMNSLLAIGITLAAIIGALRDVIGYRGLFITIGAIAFIALLVILWLPEPRRPHKVLRRAHKATGAIGSPRAES